MNDRTGQIDSPKLSLQELRALRQLREGLCAPTLPEDQLSYLCTQGLIEQKLGGFVLTNLGRRELEVRKKDSELILLAHRWRRRAKGLRDIGETRTRGSGSNLLTIAARWERLAQLVDELEALEAAEPILGE